MCIMIYSKNSNIQWSSHASSPGWEAACVIILCSHHGLEFCICWPIAFLCVRAHVCLWSQRAVFLDILGDELEDWTWEDVAKSPSPGVNVLCPGAVHRFNSSPFCSFIFHGCFIRWLCSQVTLRLWLALDGCINEVGLPLICSLAICVLFSKMPARVFSPSRFFWGVTVSELGIEYFMGLSAGPLPVVHRLSKFVGVNVFTYSLVI